MRGKPSAAHAPGTPRASPAKGERQTALTKRSDAGAIGVAERVKAVDWALVSGALDAEGFAVAEGLLTRSEQARPTALLPGVFELFRSRVVMGRHGFGRGEYKYFAYPLPLLVAELRASFYPRLAPIANRWSVAMGRGVTYPEDHGRFVERCHEGGQLRPTPLLLQYGAGDYNCLHQDLYGEHVFPLQVAVLLSEPGRDFTGGELVMTEQRPRMQSRPMIVPLRQGDAAVFAVHHRPVTGARGVYRVNLRHGVSRVRSGHRHTGRCHLSRRNCEQRAAFPRAL